MTEFTFTKAIARQDFNGDCEVTLIVPRGQRAAVERFYETMRDNDKLMVAKIAKKTNKRSLDANAYLWVLLQKLAEVLGGTKEEIYREAVRKKGIFEIVPVKDEGVDFWISTWENRGIGWPAERLNPCKIGGYTNVMSYYGSSVYDTKSMANLIDYVVEEARAQGIDTMTPAELEHLKGEWNNG